MPSRPTPESTRREGVAAATIALADGRRWGFATPSTRLRPAVVPGLDEIGRPVDRIRVVAERGYPLAIRRLVEGLREACESGPMAARYEAWFALALSLLRSAHEIDAGEAAELLEVGPGELEGLVASVLAVVAGEVPEELAPPARETSDA